MDPELNPYAAPSTRGDIVPIPDEVLEGRLRLAALGLRLVFGGAAVMLVAWVAGIAVTISGGGFGIPATALGTIAVIGFCVMNVGPVLCTSVPPGYGLRSFAIATVLAQGLGLVSFGASFALGAFVTLATLLFGLVAASLFLFFLFRLAQCLRRPDLARRVRWVSIGWAMAVFGFFPMAFLGNAFEMEFGLFLALAYTSACVVVLVSYASLTAALANAITQPVASSLSETGPGD